MSVALGTEGLQPQDLVLTIFGAFVRRPGQTVWSGGMVEILEGLGFTTGAARAALARLVNRDLLARTRQGRLAFYSLTHRADALLADGDRRIFSFARTAPAVDVWTVLWHAIPEERRVERSRFASRLRFLGFGAVHDATWVAARDREQEVRMLLRELDIEPYATILTGHMSRGLPPKALVAQTWRLDLVQEHYEAFLSRFRVLCSKGARRDLEPAAAFNVRTVMLHRFRGFPFMDPELPRDVDPLGELRAEVVATFDEVYGGLEETATDYFWQIANPAAAASEGVPAKRRPART